jgi:hypothetical protein
MNEMSHSTCYQRQVRCFFSVILKNIYIYYFNNTSKNKCWFKKISNKFICYDKIVFSYFHIERTNIIDIVWLLSQNRRNKDSGYREDNKKKWDWDKLCLVVMFKIKWLFLYLVRLW